MVYTLCLYAKNALMLTVVMGSCGWIALIYQEPEWIYSTLMSMHGQSHVLHDFCTLNLRHCCLELQGPACDCPAVAIHIAAFGTTSAVVSGNDGPFQWKAHAVLAKLLMGFMHSGL